MAVHQPMGMSNYVIERERIIMKIKQNVFLSVVIVVLLLLIGCNSSSSMGENESESFEIENKNPLLVKAEIAEIRNSFSKDFEGLKSKTYDNLDFSKTVCSPFPQIDEVSELTLTPLVGKSTDEIYDFFSEAVDILTGNKYTEEQKRYEIRFVDANDDPLINVDNSESADTPPYPYNHPNIDEYKNGKETNYPWPKIDNKDYFIDMMFGVIRGFDNGALVEYDHSDSRLTMYFMIRQNDQHRPVFYTEDLTCTDTYRLVDGEISIADAAKFAQNYLDEFKFTPYEGNIPKPQIFAINVVDIGGGCYGYNFLTTVEYNSVFFDHRDMKGMDVGTLGVLTDYDKRSYDSILGNIDMIETDKIHHFLSVASGVDITEGEPTSEIITVGSAADAVSEFFSGYMNFTVMEVSMVWLSTNDPNEIVEQAYPCWKFKMSANGEIYHTFVNVISGEIYLYVQVV